MINRYLFSENTESATHSPPVASWIVFRSEYRPPFSAAVESYQDHVAFTMQATINPEGEKIKTEPTKWSCKHPM
jgi:hypothetical protein